MGRQQTGYSGKNCILKELQQDTNPDRYLLKLLEGCLSRQPRIDLKENYIRLMSMYLKNRSFTELDALQKEIMGGCRKIALASRGFWNRHSISDRESAVLKELSALF